MNICVCPPQGQRIPALDRLRFAENEPEEHYPSTWRKRYRRWRDSGDEFSIEANGMAVTYQ